MVRAQDALELLLPDADAVEVRRARNVTHFLRLLSNDAQPARARTVGVDLERARHELDRADRADLERALCDLVRHHLLAVQGPDSCVWLGEPELDWNAAWRMLGALGASGGAPGIAAGSAQEAGSDASWLPSVPSPGESPERVVERLLASLERLAIPHERLALWRARATHVIVGSRTAEPLYRGALRAALSEGAPLAGVPAVGPPAGANTTHKANAFPVNAYVAGVAECLLDRGAVREARSWLHEHLALVAGDARLRQLLAWSRLALGDAAGAKTILLGLRPWPGSLPAGLAELRTWKPEWLPCLAGKSLASRPARPETAALRDRHDVGAVVLAVFVFRPGDCAQSIHAHVAPALRPRLEGWLTERADSCATSGEREHRLVVAARTIVEHADGQSPMRGALARDAARALAQAPALDDDGEVAGWLHIECEHHLLPSVARLTELARAWRGEILARRTAPSADARPTHAEDPARPGSTPGAAVFGELVSALGIKTHQRLWWGFEVDAGEPEILAQGGEGVGFAAGSAGKRRGLQRALASSGRVHFDEPDERLALRADAGSGLVLPLSFEGRICGLFAVESSRRRDFKPKDIEVAAAIVEQHALALRLAQFRAWHTARFGFEPWFDAMRPDFRAFATSLVLGARSRSPLVLTGPSGAGKLVLARWFHFESTRRDGPFKVFSCGAVPRGGLARAFDSAAGGSLVLDDVDELPVEQQEDLLRRLEGVERAAGACDEGDEHEVETLLGNPVRGPERPERPDRSDRQTGLRARILCTTRSGLGVARESGKLRADLSARLDRLALHVPPLRARREEIPPLAVHLAQRFAREEGTIPPRFEDDALALLWRQPWPCNLRDLENVVYKLVLLHAGRAVRAADVRELRRLFGVELVKRLPSRHPDRRDLVSALRTTQKPGGRANKTRAALYMGWDPDTLVARMQSEQLPENGFDGECAWKNAEVADAPDPSSGSPAPSEPEERSGPIT